ncbi:toxin-antitoxin system YwqK family antitoxin [Flavobacterium lacus]|uniref:MORN repeat protein n=1 Tax=Flavobacterium lacus TaxID=1353778 RepID=A0A328WWR8_9FLAO|nr:hypothetical protein [Flavobacterium lacus]RAR49755.1 hypothetical protein B0I10_103176 [Flavobacterium lacus]
MNKLNLISIFLIIILSSCQNREVEYYENGKIKKSYEQKDNKFNGQYKEFYENGNIKLIHIYENGILKDSSVFYNEGETIHQITHYLKKDTTYVKIFQNEKLSSEGKYFQNMKIDKWKYYDKHEKLEKVFEYITICGKHYSNQGWYFTSEGDTLIDKGNFIKYTNLKRNLKPKEILHFQMLYKSILPENSKSFVCLSSKIQDNFCNINEVKLDTIHPQNNSFDVLVSFSKKGNKNLRGFITEYQIEGYISKDSFRYAERKVYFDIPLLVE